MERSSNRPHIFIGSSTENLHWARAVQEELDSDAEGTVWTQGIFRHSSTSLESLVEEARRCDFAAFIFAPEDVALMRDREQPVARDNVIFELGLFIGELGKERCFIIMPHGEAMHVPTDLLGLTPLTFHPKRADDNHQAAVGVASNQVRRAITELAFRPRFPFPTPQAAAAAAKSTEQVQVADLENVYPSRASAFEDIAASIAKGGTIRLLSNKGDDWLGEAGAATDALLRLREEGPRFELQTILLHPDSPWLKGPGLRFLKRSREQVVDEFQTSHALVEQWCADNGCSPPHYHRHHPAWRFIQTKEALFISTYVTDAQIKTEPVLRFAPASPIYRSVKRYFNFLYEEASAMRGQLSRFERFTDKPVTLESSAGIVVTKGVGAGRKVLLVKRPRGEMALPKGHLEGIETPREAAIRESFEEAGAKIEPQQLEFFRFRPVAYVLPDELIVKVLLYYRADERREISIDPAKACWVSLVDLSTISFVDGYVRDMLAEL